MQAAKLLGAHKGVRSVRCPFWGDSGAQGIALGP